MVVRTKISSTGERNSTIRPRGRRGSFAERILDSPKELDVTLLAVGLKRGRERGEGGVSRAHFPFLPRKRAHHLVVFNQEMRIQTLVAVRALQAGLVVDLGAEKEKQQRKEEGRSESA